MQYDFSKDSVSVSKLRWEIIMNENIPLEPISIFFGVDQSPQLEITFNDILPATSVPVLGSLILNHSSDTRTFKRNHLVITSNLTIYLKEKEEWFETNLHNGTFEGLRERTTYSYQANLMVSQLRYEFYRDGKVKRRWRDLTESYTVNGKLLQVVDSDFERGMY